MTNRGSFPLLIEPEPRTRIAGAAPGSPLICCKVMPDDMPTRLCDIFDVVMSDIFPPFTVEIAVDTERFCMAP